MNKIAVLREEDELIASIIGLREFGVVDPTVTRKNITSEKN